MHKYLCSYKYLYIRKEAGGIFCCQDNVLGLVILLNSLSRL